MTELVSSEIELIGGPSIDDLKVALFDSPRTHVWFKTPTCQIKSAVDAVSIVFPGRDEWLVSGFARDPDCKHAEKWRAFEARWHSTYGVGTFRFTAAG